MLRKLSMTASFFGAPLWANAQTKPLTSAEKVYTYVEQMPHLPGGGGMPAIACHLLQLLQVPKLTGQSSWPRTKISFVVGPDGRIYNEQVFLADLVPAYRAAMLKAVRALPRFTPGYRQGKPVPVRLTIPFACNKVQ